MTRRDNFRLSAAGFTLIYVAAMGALITLAMPFLEGMREEALMFVMLPAGIVGVMLCVIAHWVRVDPSSLWD
ncbi:hypothetical protein WYO_0087 [Methylobacterium sp. GXF4]|uniref:hypothetical protein n=1 Tax=Methylobacterium sp. GXF4 TaxID=1096546 RepID=UPI00026985CB|nr:hypothetical protein [Methylobacterium sp. GXF4]EIZ87223.1 hypothetical protein WYO_0087 [Methylobacterium sp. GXF4]